MKQLITVVMGVHTRELAMNSLDTFCTQKGSSRKLHLQMCLCNIANIGELTGHLLHIKGKQPKASPADVLVQHCKHR